MVNHEFRDDGILVLHPGGPLEAADFTRLAAHVDAFLETHEKLHGILIRAKAFPGWKDFAALLAHLKFIREHHRRIEKIAVVADGAFAHVMPDLAGHFIRAEVRHFDFEREDEAWTWLKQSDTAVVRRSA